MISIPSSALLEANFELPNTTIAQYCEYEGFARSRIVRTDNHAQANAEMEVFGLPNLSTGLFVQSITHVDVTTERPFFLRDEGMQQRVVDALGIWVNTELLGWNNQDLVRYIEEHEVREAWLLTRPGETVEVAHLQARQYEYELASREGNSRRLLNLHMILAPHIEDELRAAYNAAEKVQSFL